MGPMTLPAPGRLHALRTGALCACGALALSACSPTADDDSSSGNETVQVVASFYPLVYLAETVGSDLVEVIDLTPGGADPHHLELAPVDIATMDAADMLLYLDGFQPADRKSTRLNSSHVAISYAVFCLTKKRQ